MSAWDSVKSAFGGRRKEVVYARPVSPIAVMPPLLPPRRAAVPSEGHWEKMGKELKKKLDEERKKRSKYMSG